MTIAVIDEIIAEVMRRQIEADTTDLRDRYPELATQYPYEWVGVDRGVLTRARTRAELMEKLDYSYTAVVALLDPHAELVLMF